MHHLQQMQCIKTQIIKDLYRGQVEGMLGMTGNWNAQPVYRNHGSQVYI